MGLRDIAHTSIVRFPQSLWQRRWTVVAATIVAGTILPSVIVAAEPLSTAASRSEGAQVRIATYQHDTGESYFAASVQPSADRNLLAATRDHDADIAIIIDTSATQAGDFRTDSVAALRAVLNKVRQDDRIKLFAADVRATDLSGSFTAATEVDSAIAKLSRRLPLGNTNLMSVIDSVRASLVGQPQHHNRSIIYIGDGASIDAMGNQARFAAIVDALRADRIAIHSIAIGPATNVELMAVLANQTGGVVGVVGPAKGASAEALGTQVGGSATMSPIWLTAAKLTPGMNTVQQDRLPPLRLDRDTIFVGTLDSDATGGRMQLIGTTTGSKVNIVAEATMEPSHPDFAFLSGLVHRAASNDGLTLATAGSGFLRETARILAARSEELVKAGNLALKQGNRRGAQAVAEKALQADPNNTDAQTLKRISGNRLVVQNESENLDDLFGEGAAENPFDAIDDAATPADGDELDLDTNTEPAPVVQAPPAPPVSAAPPAIDGTPPANRIVPANPPAIENSFAPDPFGVAPTADDFSLEPAGDLLDRARIERTAAEGRLRNLVKGTLREAHRQLRTNPIGVAGSLKSILATVETTPDINPQLRQELESQVRSAIRMAGRREAEFMEAQANLEQIAQGASMSAQLLEETYRRENRLQALSAEINGLIDQERYSDADGEVTLPFAELAGNSITRDSVAAHHFVDQTLMLATYDRDRRYRELRERNFVDAFSLVLKSNIPFVDEPPIHYPEADVWRRMSRRRLDRYGSIELIGDNETERRIQTSLNQETSQNFQDTPLVEAVRIIQETHDIPIVVDGRALEEIGLSEEEPITLELENVSLRSFLRLMLRELDLTYMIKDEVMQITTVEKAEQNLINKVYPVGDLVVPIISGGAGGGGMGGGGMGGGGMGGGGMGGGGGMMGGGGGMGGGGMGGGGAFAVPDDISLTEKQVAVESQSSTPAAPTTSKPVQSSTQFPSIRLETREGQSYGEAWDEFFQNLDVDSAEELAKIDSRVRSTVRLHSTKAAKAQEAGDESAAVMEFQKARDVMAAAIRSGNAQSWMYHGYAVALRATNAPSEDIERALLSAVDFAESPEELLHVAARLEEIDSNEAALNLCRQVSSIDPYRREPYVMGLRIAKRIDRVEDLVWATEGILSQAWPESFQAIVDEARLVARATQARLIDEGRSQDAEKFAKSLQQAVSHDVIVRVSWTGDADIDLAVEEPSGTVCSIDTPVSAGGGTLIGDAYPGSKGDEQGTVSETYVCPQGFSGQYRLLVRRVWGDVSTGAVTVDLLTDAGRPSQRFIRQDLPLTEKDALVIFEVKDGKRQQEIADAQLAHLQNVQSHILGQAAGPFVGGSVSNVDQNQVLSDLYRDIAAITGGVTGGVNGPAGLFGGRRGGVGFQPQITTLSEGAQLGVLAIISADRRYVRVSPFPFFSQIGDVTTFNFVTGAEGGGAGGGAGGGLGGGGFGN